MAKTIWTLAGLTLFAGAAAADPPQLASVFSDHMVIQRDQPVTIFGTAEPGDGVTVLLDSITHEARAGLNGVWWVTYGALEAGGPHTITLKSGTETVQSVSDVMAGDVFLCSGQSNMEWSVDHSLYGWREAEQAANENIRLLDISQTAKTSPQTALPEGNVWEVSDPASAADFSGVCYFTGRALQKEYGVPVGLIDASWGGSRIEPWISEKAFEAGGGYEDAVELMQLYRSDPPAALAKYGKIWTDWWKGHDWYDGHDPWTGDASLNWQPTPEGRLSDWNTWGVPQLEGFLGQVWHRTHFTLTPEQAAAGATLHIGQADDVDVTWVNGTAVGATHGWGFGRVYEVPADLLKAGENTLVVNVYNSYAGGGLTGPDADLHIDFADGASVPLDTGWTWLQVPADAGNPMPAPWYPIQGFSMLHNGMIAPLAGLKLKGALWYQGESNAGQAEAYEGLLALLAKDWRGLFNTPDLPVGVVQLPRWGDLPSEAGTEGWGAIREAMRRAAAADDRMGLIVAIDLGDPYNLHPPEKQHVAERAVRLMKALAYGEAITGPSGPEVSGVVRDGDVLRVSFSGVEDGLQTISSDTAIGFEVCNGGNCDYADAKIHDNQATISRLSGHSVDEVRYCQGDSPLCNLFDGNGLPVGPFVAEVKARP